jgi:hypothetical protein
MALVLGSPRRGNSSFARQPERDRRANAATASGQRGVADFGVFRFLPTFEIRRSQFIGVYGTPPDRRCECSFTLRRHSFVLTVHLNSMSSRFVESVQQRLLKALYRLNLA